MAPHRRLFFQKFERKTSLLIGRPVWFSPFDKVHTDTTSIKGTAVPAYSWICVWYYYQTAPRGRNVNHLKASAPLKLPARHCLDYALLICEREIFKSRLLGREKFHYLNGNFYCIPLKIHILKGHNRLELQIVKMSVSLADPSTPRSELQILLTTLRITTRRPIPSYSEASGVFPSWCG